MRDPDLVVRAQRAATALESAWGRWRGVHGITTDPPPAVSSYVGYSLDAPWGEGRIVFGICAEEAEQLAELLERHDCVGPIHASVTARPGDGPVSPPAAAAPAQPEPASLLSVPAPAPASAGQQPLPPGAVGPRPSELLAPRHPGVVRDPDAVSPLTAPETRDAGTPIARAASRAVEAAQAAQRTVPSEIAPAPPARPEAPAGPGPWTPPASQPGGSAGRSRLGRLSGLGGLGGISGAGGESPELAPVPWPDDPAGRPAAAAEVPGVPQVASFRFRRPVVMTERPAVPVAPADPAGLDDTVQTPVPVRPPGAARFDHEGDRDHDADRDRDRVASAARHADAATWGASEVPGQAAVTDSAV